MAKHTRHLHPTLPFPAWEAYRAQKDSAKRRGIPFLFTPEEWWDWWQVDNRWERRGMGADALVMARKGDQGPYSADNVDCLTHAQNLQAIPKGRRGLKGSAVVTPEGRFESVQAAADSLGYATPTIYEWIRIGRDGWRYEAPPAPSAPGKRRKPGIQKGQSGTAHPRSRAVITPGGRFDNAALAAEHYEITRQHAARMARLGMEGWRYEGQDAPRRETSRSTSSFMAVHGTSGGSPRATEVGQELAVGS